MDLVIHQVFKMEAKEEFGWLLSCVHGLVGRCCPVAMRCSRPGRNSGDEGSTVFQGHQKLSNQDKGRIRRGCVCI